MAAGHMENDRKFELLSILSFSGDHNNFRPVWSNTFKLLSNWIESKGDFHTKGLLAIIFFYFMYFNKVNGRTWYNRNGNPLIRGTCIKWCRFWRYLNFCLSSFYCCPRILPDFFSIAYFAKITVLSMPCCIKATNTFDTQCSHSQQWKSAYLHS